MSFALAIGLIIGVPAVLIVGMILDAVGGGLWPWTFEDDDEPP